MARPGRSGLRRAAPCRGRHRCRRARRVRAAQPQRFALRGRGCLQPIIGDGAEVIVAQLRSECECFAARARGGTGLARPDVLVSQQVIQHFPSRAYTDRFFAQVNSSGALVVMLQTKLPSWHLCVGAVEGNMSLGFCSHTAHGYFLTPTLARSNNDVYGGRDVTTSSLVSTPYLTEALRGAYVLRAPRQLQVVNGVTHAYHIFEVYDRRGCGANGTSAAGKWRSDGLNSVLCGWGRWCERVV